MTSRNSRPSGQLLERVVFGSMIACGMFFLCAFIMPAAYGHWRTRKEKAVFALLTSVEEVRMSSSRGIKTSTKATFVYEIDGKEYSGDRVSLWRNTGQFFDYLDSAWRTRQSIIVFIDPDDPSFAVYDREFSVMPSALAAIMGIVPCGLGIHGFLWRYRRTPKRTKR